ncbi:MAG: tetratricopeptide repeat protein [Anaerolineae bacterium]|nr:tetratricopeptide repeat protein [Anaerolineae bacterium]
MHGGSDFDDQNGLPLDPNLIPNGDDLAEAALHALHREVSFVLYYKDQPQVIAERLGQIDEMVCAALTVKGSSNAHLLKAIQFALALDWPYWMASRRFAAWQNIILMMISTVRELRDQQLQSRIFRAWGTYLLLSRKYDGARIALDGAIKDLDDLEQDDLKLLMRTERFNIDVAREPLAAMQAQVPELLAEADRLQFRYIKGRVYYALAKAYRRAGQYKTAFMYAQQALLFFLAEAEQGLAAQSLIAMVAILVLDQSDLNDYELHVLAYTESLMQQNVNPWIRAQIYHSYAAHSFAQGHYPQARGYCVRAWWEYYVIGDKDGCARMYHLLGMVYSKLGRARLARYYLTTARTLYDQLDNDYHFISAWHALGYMLYEQEKLEEALSELRHARNLALTRLTDPNVRQRIVESIEEDIATVEKALRISTNAAD